MENPFNIPLSSDEDIRKMIGTTINCIDLTPFTALSGTLLGYIRPDEGEEIKSMILSVDKEYESAEELSEFVISWDELIGISDEELDNLLVTMNNKVPLEIDEDNIYLNFAIDRELLDKKKIIILPFTHCSTEAF